MRFLFATSGNAGHVLPLGPVRAAPACAPATRSAWPARTRAARSWSRPASTSGRSTQPPEDEVAALLGVAQDLSRAEADVLMGGDLYGRLKPRAALPGMLAEVEAWRPDAIVREGYELASSSGGRAPSASRTCAPATGLASTEDWVLSFMAAGGLPNLSVDGIRSSPYLSHDAAGAGRRAPAATGSGTAPARRRGRCRTWWPGVDGPLVYVTFGSMCRRDADASRRSTERPSGSSPTCRRACCSRSATPAIRPSSARCRRTCTSSAGCRRRTSCRTPPRWSAMAATARRRGARARRAAGRGADVRRPAAQRAARGRGRRRDRASRRPRTCARSSSTPRRRWPGSASLVQQAARRAALRPRRPACGRVGAGAAAGGRRRGRAGGDRREAEVSGTIRRTRLSRRGMSDVAAGGLAGHHGGDDVTGHGEVLSGSGGGRSSDDELGGEDDGSGRGRLEQQAHGLGSLAVVGLADGGERRSGERGLGDVVEAGDRELAPGRRCRARRRRRARRGRAGRRARRSRSGGRRGRAGGRRRRGRCRASLPGALATGTALQSMPAASIAGAPAGEPRRLDVVPRARLAPRRPVVPWASWPSTIPNRRCPSAVRCSATARAAPSSSMLTPSWPGSGVKSTRTYGSRRPRTASSRGSVLGHAVQDEAVDERVLDERGVAALDLRHEREALPALLAAGGDAVQELHRRRVGEARA